MPAAGGPAPQRRVNDLPEPTWRLLLGRGLPQFALEAVVPVLAFYAGLQAAGLAAGILATSVVSIAIAVRLVRRGRDVSLVALGVVFVAIQAAVGLVSGSTTAYLAQPVVFRHWRVRHAVQRRRRRYRSRVDGSMRGGERRARLGRSRRSPRFAARNDVPRGQAPGAPEGPGTTLGRGAFDRLWRRHRHADATSATGFRAGGASSGSGTAWASTSTAVSSANVVPCAVRT